MPGKGDIASLLARSHTENVNPFAALTSYADKIRSNIRQDEADARDQLLFQQKQDEYNRQLLDRNTKQAYANALLGGPQTQYRDITQASEKIAADLGVDPTKVADNLEIFRKGTDAQGNLPTGTILGGDYAAGTYYADKDMTKELTKADYDDRLKRQKLFGGLTEETIGSRKETQPEYLSRALEAAKVVGGDISPYVNDLMQARVLEETTKKTKTDQLTK